MPHPIPDTDTGLARFVIRNPEHYLDRPHLFRGAWIALMHARGLTAHPDRLGPSRHAEWVREVPPVVTYFESRRASIRDRVRARAAQIGLTLPGGPEGAA